MILWSIKIILLSAILIFIVHNLFGFFKDTLTTPKVKDLVNKPQQRYNEILNTIEKNKPKINTSVNRNINAPRPQEVSNNSLEKNSNTTIDKSQMKDELKHFLSEIKNKPVDSGGIQSVGNFESSNAFGGNDYENAY